MAIWVLRARDLPREADPWRKRYDCCVAQVVIAPNEEQARQLAQDHAGDEHDGVNGTRAWLESCYSECTQLDPDSEKTVVLRKIPNG